MQIQHGTEHLTDAEILRRWLDTIPRGEYNNVIARLVETCLIPIHTLRNWRYGNCRIPEAGKRDINIVTREVSGIEIYKIVMPEVIVEGVSGRISGKTI